MNYIILTNTYKRSIELVTRSLRASLGQTVVPRRVILVDQNWPQLELSREIEENALFEHQRTKFSSVSEARNDARLPDDVDWIVFCDDDGYLADDYSEKLESYILRHPEVEVIAGSIIREDTMSYYSLRHKKGGSLKKFINTKNLMGSNFVVRRSVFEEMGKFDPEFGAGAKWGSGEETDFCWKCFFAGKDMEFIPDLRVIHIPPFNESLCIGFKKTFRYGVGKGALVAKWLFEKNKPLVLIELIEMFLVPPIQVLRGLFTFKLGLITNNIAAFAGRLFGLMKKSCFKFYSV